MVAYSFDEAGKLTQDFIRNHAVEQEETYADMRLRTLDFIGFLPSYVRIIRMSA